MGELRFAVYDLRTVRTNTPNEALSTVIMTYIFKGTYFSLFKKRGGYIFGCLMYETACKCFTFLTVILAGLE